MNFFKKMFGTKEKADSIAVKKVEISEEELANDLFELMWRNTIDFYEGYDLDETGEYFIELIILNIFLIIEFSSAEVSHKTLDLVVYRFWETLMGELNFSREEIDSLSQHQSIMWELYKNTLEENKNENYIERLSVQFLSHITKTEFSSYTEEALVLSREIVENMKIIIELTNNITIKTN